MWLEPLNATQTTYKLYYGHVPKPVDMIVSCKKQNEIVQNLLTDRDILVREEVKKKCIYIYIHHWFMRHFN
jgi:metaxin